MNALKQSASFSIVQNIFENDKKEAIISQLYHVSKSCIVFRDSDAFYSASNSAKPGYLTEI